MSLALDPYRTAEPQNRRPVGRVSCGWDRVGVGGEGGYSGDEELRAVGVGAGVGHGQETGFGVSQLEVLVRKFLAVDGLSARTAVD